MFQKSKKCTFLSLRCIQTSKFSLIFSHVLSSDFQICSCLAHILPNSGLVLASKASKARLVVRSPESVQGHGARPEVDSHLVLPCWLSNRWLSSKCKCQQLFHNKWWNPLEHFSCRVSSVSRTWEGHCKGKGPSSVSGCSLVLPWCRCQDVGQS